MSLFNHLFPALLLSYLSKQINEAVKMDNFFNVTHFIFQPSGNPVFSIFFGIEDDKIPSQIINGYSAPKNS